MENDYTSSSSDDETTHKKSGRPSKADKYEQERNDVLKKLNKILGITENNKVFYMCDIDEKKQKLIEALKSDIKKYFTVNNTKVFEGKVDREFLSLLKVVYSGMKISLIRAQKTVERNDKKISTGCYIVGIDAF